MTAMHWFRAAQPALLYLSPACILSIASTGLVRGEWKAVWAFTEEEETAEERSKREKTDKGAASEALQDSGIRAPKEEGADTSASKTESVPRRKTRSTE